MAQQPLILRPMTVADIIDTAIGVYRYRFAPLLGIAAVVQVPLMALQVSAMFLVMRALLTSGGELQIESLLVGAGWGLGALALGLLLLPLGEAALAIGVSESYLGRPISVWGAYRAAQAYWGQVLWTAMLYYGLLYLCALGGVVVLSMVAVGAAAGVRAANAPEAVAGVLAVLVALVLGLGVLALVLWCAIRYVLAPAVIVVLEGRSGVDGMGRSAQLVRGSFWSVFATLVLLTLMVYVAAQGITLPVQLGIGLIAGGDASGEGQMLLATAVGQALAATVAILLRPLSMIGVVLIYYDLRVRKEGFDLMMMAEALGLPAPTPTAHPQAALYPQQSAEPPPAAAPPWESETLPGPAFRGGYVSEAKLGEVKSEPPPVAPPPSPADLLFPPTPPADSPRPEDTNAEKEH